ncbi:hypothetical protein ACFSHT_27440, partial [Paraburkholderia silviterrae]|uniref:hypothetical protein n=1 Tax=Paraburkholderia silviterrae TaxID=2528715 RepID=UPI0036279252
VFFFGRSSRAPRCSSGQPAPLEPSVPGLPPATENAFHITEFTSNFRCIIFPPFESVFYIAKLRAYLIEK